jgi:hypothetical protein
VEVHGVYSLPNIIIMIKIRRMRWDRYGKKRNKCRILVGKPEGKSPLGRPGKRGRIILKWGAMDWIRLAQDGGQCRVLLNTGMNLRIP